MTDRSVHRLSRTGIHQRLLTHYDPGLSRCVITDQRVLLDSHTILQGCACADGGVLRNDDTITNHLFKQEFQEYGDTLISGIENNVDA